MQYLDALKSLQEQGSRYIDTREEIIDKEVVDCFVLFSTVAGLTTSEENGDYVTFDPQGYVRSYGDKWDEFSYMGSKEDDESILWATNFFERGMKMEQLLAHRNRKFIMQKPDRIRRVKDLLSYKDSFHGKISEHHEGSPYHEAWFWKQNGNGFCIQVETGNIRRFYCQKANTMYEAGHDLSIKDDDIVDEVNNSLRTYDFDDVGGRNNYESPALRKSYELIWEKFVKGCK